MRGVFEKLLLGVESDLKAVKHAVDRTGHRTDLVPISQSGSQSESVGRNLIGQASDRLKRLQSAFGGDPGANERQENTDRSGDDCGVKKLLLRFHQRLERRRCQGILTGIDRDTGDPKAPVWQVQRRNSIAAVEKVLGPS